MKISDDLLCVFTARLEEQNGSYVIEVPDQELRHGVIERESVYRVALVSGPESAFSTSPQRTPQSGREPPVEEGDMRVVEIESLGEQGDGIAKVDRGFVVIVPGTELGDEVEIEIEDVRRNFAIGRVVEDWFETEST